MDNTIQSIIFISYFDQIKFPWGSVLKMFVNEVSGFSLMYNRRIMYINCYGFHLVIALAAIELSKQTSQEESIQSLHQVETVL